jgi:hypothetical protein
MLFIVCNIMGQQEQQHHHHRQYILTWDFQML